MNSKQNQLWFCLLVLLSHSLLGAEFKGESHSGLNSCSYEGAVNYPPIAVNDTIMHYTGCGRNTVTGNILQNDYTVDGDDFCIYFINAPQIGPFEYEKNGNFKLRIPDGYEGEVKFEYYIIDLNEKAYKALGEVLVSVRPDNDCDNVGDDIDLDNDNDGLLNTEEGNGNIDSDGDGISNDFDIDSDNDGITDIIEWQKEGSFIKPSGKDLNNNGWDDSYDSQYQKSLTILADTDADGVADYIDLDSDEDGISDTRECTYPGFEEGNDDLFMRSDLDKDGLCDRFDNIGCWSDNRNVFGSNVDLKDSNLNGIRDWRDRLNNQLKGAFIYPNPVRNQLSVTHPQVKYGQQCKIMIFDTLGRLVLTRQLTPYQKTDVSELENAMYVVKLVTEGIEETQTVHIRK